MAKLNEQIAQHPPTKQSVTYDKYPEKRFHLNAKGQLVEDTPLPPYSKSRAAKQDETIYIPDEPMEEDDFIEDDEVPSIPRRTRQVSIERTSQEPRTPAANRTMLRVTKHAGPPVPRTSRTTTSQPPVKHAQKRLHWLFYVGTGMLASFALWAAGSTAWSLGQTVHDTVTYGTPRTFQVDANVGHQGISHFIAQNLNGDIVVIEENPSDLAQTHIYQGPVFGGPGKDAYVATVSFKDVNGDGKPDLIIAVNNQRFVLINTGSAFRPSTPTDHIDQQEVN